MSRCMRCGGPLGYMDQNEGLCSAGDGPHGCFVVFLQTLQAINYPIPALSVATETWWRETYRHVAMRGNTWPLQVTS